jgi:hypothetical protein
MKKASRPLRLKQEEQRFYARTGRKTTLDHAGRHRMQPYQADAPTRTGPQLALLSLLDETVATLARLVVYVGILALLAILGLYGLQQLPELQVEQLARTSGWSDSDVRTGSYGRTGRPAAAPESDWLTGAETAQLRGAL